MMVYTGTPARYISIAAPNRREWAPISFGSKPRCTLPMEADAAPSAVSIWRDEICSSLLWRQIAQTGVSSVVPGYVQIQLTSRAHWKMGQSVVLSVFPWITVSCFESFFCILNVTATLSDHSKLSEGAERRCPSLENLMFLKHKSFVCFMSWQGTFRYSQERHAKKAALIVSCTMALSKSVTCLFANSLRTTKGRAFCCTCLGSSFLKALDNHDRRMLSLLSVSFMGFGLPFSLKVCTTCEMVPLTVPSARHLWHSCKYLPSWTAMAKAPSMRILSCRESLSM